jgi:hypothetical protein
VQYNTKAQYSNNSAVPARCRAIPTPSDPSMRLLRAVMKERKVTRPDIIRLEQSLRRAVRVRVRVRECE